MSMRAIILYGPPGGGKGTQANLLADRFHLLHFDTGRFLESVVHDPHLATRRLIRRERKLFDTGKLLTPRWVAKVVAARVKEVYRARWGIIFSGSPRTIFEAKKILPVLRRLYGKHNIYIVVLEVPAAASLRRNSSRLICRVCGAPLLVEYYPRVAPRHCPICGGSLYRRSLDNPVTIHTRLKEYRERTEPIFALMKQQGYRIVRIDGTPPPYKVFQKISQLIAGAVGRNRRWFA